MANRREYVYTNMMYLVNGRLVVLKNDGYLYMNGSSRISAVSDVIQFDSNWDSGAILTKSKQVYTTNWSSYNLISNLSDKKVCWVTGGYKNGGSFAAVTENDELYVWGQNPGQLGTGNSTNVSTPTKITLPNGEKPFMILINDTTSAVLTSKGNLYYCGYFYANNANVFTFTKAANIANVTHFAILHDSPSPYNVHIYAITVDGSCYRGSYNENRFSSWTKLNVSNAKYVFSRNNDGTHAILVDAAGNGYFTSGNNLAKINVSNITTGGVGNEYYDTGIKISDTSGKIYEGSSTSANLNTTASANAKPTTFKVDGLAVEFPSDIKGTYDKSPNGLKYQYKVSFIQTDQITETSNVVNYVTEWGMDQNCGNRFEPSCGSVEFNSTTASNSVQILSQAATAAITKLQDQLNKYIGPFDNTKNTKSGSHKSKGNNQTYYWKIETTGKVDNYTSIGSTATFKAVWGTSANNYNVTYVSSSFTKGSIVHDGKTITDVYSMSSDGTVNFEINPTTYSHREAVFTEIINKLKNNLELQFDNYIGTLETSLPYISRSITSAGTNYYARVIPTTGGNTSITATNAILKLKLYWSAGRENLDVEFGTGKTGVPGKAGEGEKEFTINASNYLTLDSFIATEAAAMLNSWEAYVRTLFSKLTQAPSKQEDSWNTTTGNKIWVLMTFTLDSNPTTMADESKQIIYSKFKYSLNSSLCEREYKDDSITLDSSNYSMKETVFQNHFNAAVAEFKNDFSFLNSVPPEDNTINHTALNGLTYTCKYSWEFAERDPSRAIYRLVSSYSLASNLSNATEFSRQRTVEVDRNTVAYDIRMQRFNAAFELEKVALENYLNTLLASVTIPDPVKNDSYVATNGRLYAYRVLCTVVPGDSDAEKKVTIKSEWGKTTTYGNEFATSTFTLTAVNQKAFDSTVARVMRAHQVKMEGFLNLLIEDVIFQGANGSKRASNGSDYNYRTSVTGVGITTKTPAQYIQETGTIETFSE